MQNLQKSLDAFFKADKAEVAIIKGNRGVGKTYFWDEYIAKKINDKNSKLLTYSYISLFGKTSLSDIRKSILDDNYVICFDDLERKADTLTIKEIMGLIDELAKRKNCKVILIFNENELGTDVDKTEFDLYREKVVDIELNYEPTYVENMKIARLNGSNRLSIIKNVVNELNIDNIRVLIKIRQMIEEFHVFEKNLSDSFIKEFITHAIFLCWGYCICSKGLSFKYIKFHLSKNSLILFGYDKDKEKEKTSGEKRCSQIAYKLELKSSHFDSHIINYLERGVVDQKKLNTDQLNEEVKNIENEHDPITDGYTPELIDKLENVLNKYMDNVELSVFSNAIRILKEGRKEKVPFYIKKYIGVIQNKCELITDGYTPELINELENILNKYMDNVELSAFSDAIKILEKGGKEKVPFYIKKYIGVIQNKYEPIDDGYTPEVIDELENILNKYMDNVELSAFSDAIGILEKEREGRVSSYIKEYIKANKESLKNMSPKDIKRIENNELRTEIQNLQIED